MNRLYVLARKPQLAVRYLADEHLSSTFELLGGSVLHAQATLLEKYMVRRLELQMRGHRFTGIDTDQWSRNNRALEELRRDVLPKVREESDLARWVLSTELIYDWTLRFVRELADELRTRLFTNDDHPLQAFLNRVGLDGLRPISVGLPRGDLFGNSVANRHVTGRFVEEQRAAYENDFDLYALHWTGRKRQPWKARHDLRSNLAPTSSNR